MDSDEKNRDEIMQHIFRYVIAPDICSVPMRPTMMLSSRLTKLVTVFCMMMGMTMVKTRL